MNLSQLIAATNQQQANSKATVAGVTSAYGQAIAAQNRVVDAEERIGVNNAIIEGQKKQGELEAQNNARRFAEEAGTNISEESNILSLLGEQQRELALDVLQRSQRVQRLDEVAHLGNPLGFIYDAFFGESERGQLETARNSLNSVRDTIQGLNQSTQQVALTQNAIAETLTDATVAATADLQLANATKAAEEARVKVAAAQVDMLTTVNQLNRQGLDDMFRIVQAQGAAESRQLAREQRKALAAEREELRKAKELQVEDYNLGAKALGLRPVNSYVEIPTTGAAGERSRYIMDKGWEFSQTNKLTFGGDTPTEAVAWADAYPNAALNESQKYGINLAREYFSDYDTNPIDAIRRAGLAKSDHEAREIYSSMKTGEQRLALRDGTVQAMFSNMVRVGVKPEDTTHPLALAPIGNAAGSPILEENPVLRKYIAPLVEADPESMFDPGKLAEWALEDLRKGEFSTGELTDATVSMAKLLGSKTVLARGFSDIAGFQNVESLNMSLTAKSPTSLGPNIGMRLIFGNSHSATVNVWDATDVDKFYADYVRKSQGFDFGRALDTILNRGD